MSQSDKTDAIQWIDNNLIHSNPVRNCGWEKKSNLRVFWKATMDADKVVEKLHICISFLGPPAILQSDNGS